MSQILNRVDEKYYQAVPSGSFAERVLINARNRIYADFLRVVRPRPVEILLDAGVSDVISNAANLIERLYPYPERITAVGIGEAQDFIAAYPAVVYCQIEPHRPLPYADRSFDIACSNAVIEHLGTRANQAAFVADIARVAKRVFLTVPNRYFPIEHHTALPLVAWNRRSFAAACRRTGKAEWLDEQNLILMSRKSLAALCPPGRRMQIGYTGLRLGPFSSNLYLYFEE